MKDSAIIFARSPGAAATTRAGEADGLTDPGARGPVAIPPSPAAWWLTAHGPHRASVPSRAAITPAIASL